jgi:hypothetical protein
MNNRWQLQNAGKKEEKYCRFCQQRYPDWRNSLTPGEITPSTPVSSPPLCAPCAICIHQTARLAACQLGCLPTQFLSQLGAA